MLAERKMEVGGQERGQLERAKRSGAWLTAVPYRLNDMNLTREELRDSLCLWYGIILLNLPSA